MIAASQHSHMLLFTLLFQCKWPTFCAMHANSQFQMCAMQLATTDVHKFDHPLILSSVKDRLQIVLIAGQCYWLMKAQAKQLPIDSLPMGRVEVSTFSKVQF